MFRILSIEWDAEKYLMYGESHHCDFIYRMGCRKVPHVWRKSPLTTSISS